MSNQRISYVIGAPVVIEIDSDGKLTVTVDLAEAGDDIEFGYGNASLGDDEVEDGYDDETVARIADALKRAGYTATVTI